MLHVNQVLNCSKINFILALGKNLYDVNSTKNFSTKKFSYKRYSLKSVRNK